MLDRGRITKQHTVWCACECWVQFDVSTQAEAGKAAKASGWKYSREKGWICPGCVKGIPPGQHRFHGCEGEGR